MVGTLDTRENERTVEGRLFELLETEAKIRLGDLVRLRRISRVRKVTLLDVALAEGRLNETEATMLAIKADISWSPEDAIFSDGSDHTFPGMDDSLDSIIDAPPEALVQTDSINEHLEDLLDADEPVLVAPSGRPTIPHSGPYLLTESVSLPAVDSLSELPNSTLISSDPEMSATDAIRLQARTFSHEYHKLSKSILSGQSTDRAELGRTLGWAARAHNWLTESGNADADDRQALTQLLMSAQEWAASQGQAEWAAFFQTLTGGSPSVDMTGETGAIGALVELNLDGGPGDVSLLKSACHEGEPPYTEVKHFDGTTRIMGAFGSGSFVAVVDQKGSRWRHPFVFDGETDLTVALRSPTEMLDTTQYAYVTGGEFQLGGDVLAHNSAPQRAVVMEDFALSRHMVNCREYCDFLNAIAASRGLDEARQNCPRDAISGTPLWPINDGKFIVPDTDAAGQRWDPSYSVSCINVDDAQAYCRWLNKTRGPGHRLPAEDEWEIAARGVDGRTFPWGDVWTGQECHTRKATMGAPTRDPGREFKSDLSPYGVEGMAGGLSEWTCSTLKGQTVIKGGHWRSGAMEARTASRYLTPGESVSPTIGFRVALEAEEEMDS